MIRLILVLCLVIPLETRALRATEPTTAAASKPLRLTMDGKSKADPVFVQNGEELIFTQFESPT